MQNNFKWFFTITIHDHFHEFFFTKSVKTGNRNFRVLGQLRYRSIQHLKMTVRISVSWKIIMDMAKNWLEMVVKWWFMFRKFWDSPFSILLHWLLFNLSRNGCHSHFVSYNAPCKFSPLPFPLSFTTTLRPWLMQI